MEIANTIAAWWGAIVATCVGIYTIYARRRDERIDLSAKYFRTIGGVVDVRWPIDRIMVSNNGKRATTIHKVEIEDRSIASASILSNIDNQQTPLPITLGAGAHWNGFAETELPEQISNGSSDNIFVTIFHTHSESPVRINISAGAES